MSRRPHSSTPEPRPVKRQRLEHPPLTPDDYKGGVVLAPMVRSGALPTRLFALKHGAKLVWGPEIIDKAILHAERVVDPVSGVIQYHGKSKAMFTTHPIEKPYYIFQIGSASPELAVQAAKVIMDDVAGVDLNCGCPKPFSTSGGMGAALLSTPDLLCDILRALRAELPARVSVSAKIRLLPNQEDTLKLVEQICNTGINALTVHCRTRNQRMREKATIERLREIVAFVEGLGKNIAVIANGDCQSFEDAKRVKEVTNAHSVMIATAAESNPTVFSPTPLVDAERTLVPQYIRLCKYLDNHWSSTKWCIAQFKAPHPGMTKAEHKADRDIITHAKSYADVLPIVGGEEGLAQGKAELDAIQDILEQREVLRRAEQPETAFTAAVQESGDISAMSAPASEIDAQTRSQVEASLEAPPAEDELVAEPEPVTPKQRINPEPPSSRAPHIPSNLSKQVMPASVFNQDTPTPGGGVELPAIS